MDAMVSLLCFYSLSIPQFFKYDTFKCYILLANISDGNSRSKRWCDLCKEYNLEQIEFSNSQITDFIKHSTEGKLAIVGIEADKMRNRLM